MTFTLQIEDSAVDNFMWVLDHFKDVVKVTPKNENDEDKVDYTLLKQTRNESAISLNKRGQATFFQALMIRICFNSCSYTLPRMRVARATHHLSAMGPGVDARGEEPLPQIRALLVSAAYHQIVGTFFAFT